MERFPGTATTLYSADQIVDADDADATSRIPTEYLNSQKPSGMADHALSLSSPTCHLCYCVTSTHARGFAMAPGSYA